MHGCGCMSLPTSAFFTVSTELTFCLISCKRDDLIQFMLLNNNVNPAIAMIKHTVILNVLGFRVCQNRISTSGEIPRSAQLHSFESLVSHTATMQQHLCGEEVASLARPPLRQQLQVCYSLHRPWLAGVPASIQRDCCVRDMRLVEEHVCTRICKKPKIQRPWYMSKH